MAQRIDRAGLVRPEPVRGHAWSSREPVPFTQAVINGLAQGGGSLRSRRAADAES